MGDSWDHCGPGSRDIYMISGMKYGWSPGVPRGGGRQDSIRDWNHCILCNLKGGQEGVCTFQFATTMA